MKQFHQRGTARLIIAMGLLVAVSGGPGLAAPCSNADLAQALKLCVEAHALLMGEHFDQAEPKIRDAATLVPEWSTPHALLGVLYQWKSFRIRQNLLSGNADKLKQQALREYEVVQAASRQTVVSAVQEPPWLVADQWLAPAQGLFGGTPANIRRALDAQARPTNPVLSQSKLVPGGLSEHMVPEAGEDGDETNELPPSVRFNDNYYAKYGKAMVELENEYEALACYEVNERRLMVDKNPMVPEAALSVLARAFSLWCAILRKEQHKDLVKRFETAFPEPMRTQQYLVGEVLSMCGSRYGQYVLDGENIEKAVYGFFKSPGHAECLLDRDNLFMGPAIAQVHQCGDFFLTINVVRSASRVRPSGTGARPGTAATASR